MVDVEVEAEAEVGVEVTVGNCSCSSVFGFLESDASSSAVGRARLVGDWKNEAIPLCMVGRVKGRILGRRKEEIMKTSWKKLKKQNKTKNKNRKAQTQIHNALWLLSTMQQAPRQEMGGLGGRVRKTCEERENKT